MLQITALFSIFPHFGKKPKASQTKKSMCTVYELAALLTHSLGVFDSKGHSWQSGGSNGDRRRKATELTVLGKVFILLVFSLVSAGAVAQRCLSDLGSKNCYRAVQVWGLEVKELQSKWAHGSVDSPHWRDLSFCLLWHRSLLNYRVVVTHNFSAGCCLFCRNGKSSLGPTASCCCPFELRRLFAFPNTLKWSSTLRGELRFDGSLRL